jgi:hypothetical protein
MIPSCDQTGDDVGIRFLDQPAHPVERLAAPVTQLGDPVRDELFGRLRVASVRLVHRSRRVMVGGVGASTASADGIDE